MFENKNWNLQSINSKTYLVKDKATYFYFTFSDAEQDNVVVRMEQSEVVSSFAIFNITLNSSQVLLQPNYVSDEPVFLVFYYTDSYHQDALFWSNLSLSVNIFDSEPPVFNSPIENIHVNRCQNAEIKLPRVSDPDTQSLK